LIDAGSHRFLQGAWHSAFVISSLSKTLRLSTDGTWILYAPVLLKSPLQEKNPLVPPPTTDDEEARPANNRRPQLLLVVFRNRHWHDDG
jgi:hypothetical protein